MEPSTYRVPRRRAAEPEQTRGNPRERNGVRRHDRRPQWDRATATSRPGRRRGRQGMRVAGRTRWRSARGRSTPRERWQTTDASLRPPPSRESVSASRRDNLPNVPSGQPWGGSLKRQVLVGEARPHRPSTIDVSCGRGIGRTMPAQPANDRVDRTIDFQPPPRDTGRQETPLESREPARCIVYNCHDNDSACND